jgi:hypothetical protein
VVRGVSYGIMHLFCMEYSYEVVVDYYGSSTKVIVVRRKS